MECSALDSYMKKNKKSNPFAGKKGKGKKMPKGKKIVAKAQVEKDMKEPKSKRPYLED